MTDLVVSLLYYPPSITQPRIKNMATIAILKPTDPVTFGEKTALLIDVIVQCVLDEAPRKITLRQQIWFTAFCDTFIRHLHAANPSWTNWLENRAPRIDPPAQCRVWIRHWLAAFVLDPVKFMANHHAEVMN
jgi:hypothetical protein